MKILLASIFLISNLFAVGQNCVYQKLKFIQIDSSRQYVDLLTYSSETNKKENITNKKILLLSKNQMDSLNLQIGDRMKACLVRIENDSLARMESIFTVMDGGFHGKMAFPEIRLEYYKIEKTFANNR